MYKIIGADQKEYGPIAADQLRQWISEGRINGETKVLTEGATLWKRAADVPEQTLLLPHQKKNVGLIGDLSSNASTSQKRC